VVAGGAERDEKASGWFDVLNTGSGSVGRDNLIVLPKPLRAAHRQGADAGGLMGYALAAPPIYEQAAGYVHRILKGARPEDLPVVPATEAEFVINLKAAQAIGLSIPEAVLEQATEILR